jgi:hypothetical protein
MVVFVPPGDDADPTRKPEYYDDTFAYLANLGGPEPGPVSHADDLAMPIEGVAQISSSCYCVASLHYGYTHGPKYKKQRGRTTRG